MNVRPPIVLHAFRNLAKSRNRPTPETDVFLASVPDGVAEQHWSPGYTLYTLMAGYRTKVMLRKRRTAGLQRGRAQSC